jgi:HEPN domain-containing protein
MKWSEQVKVLLQKAEIDLIAAEELLPSARVADAVIGFHLQQAVEKLLKALLAARDIPYRKTHDIRQLMDLLEDHQVLLPEPLADLDDFTPYAVELRYDDLSYESSRFNRVTAMARVKALDNWIREMLRIG